MDEIAHCYDCGSELEIVRPGKWQCLNCCGLPIYVIKSPPPLTGRRCVIDSSRGSPPQGLVMVRMLDNGFYHDVRKSQLREV